MDQSTHGDPNSSGVTPSSNRPAATSALRVPGDAFSTLNLHMQYTTKLPKFVGQYEFPASLFFTAVGSSAAAPMREGFPQMPSKSSPMAIKCSFPARTFGRCGFDIEMMVPWVQRVGKYGPR